MARTVTGEQRVRMAPNVSTSELHGELVLLNFATESYYGLDAIGARMVAVLTAEPSVDRAVEVLLGEYDVDAERLRADVDRLLAKLVAGGLVDLDAG
jgi:hypothetical protein